MACRPNWWNFAQAAPQVVQRAPVSQDGSQEATQVVVVSGDRKPNLPVEPVSQVGTILMRCKGGNTAMDAILSLDCVNGRGPSSLAVDEDRFDPLIAYIKSAKLALGYLSTQPNTIARLNPWTFETDSTANLLLVTGSAFSKTSINSNDTGPILDIYYNAETHHLYILTSQFIYELRLTLSDIRVEAVRFLVHKFTVSSSGKVSIVYAKTRLQGEAEESFVCILTPNAIGVVSFDNAIDNVETDVHQLILNSSPKGAVYQANLRRAFVLLDNTLACVSLAPGKMPVVLRQTNAGAPPLDMSALSFGPYTDQLLLTSSTRRPVMLDTETLQPISTACEKDMVNNYFLFTYVPDINMFAMLVQQVYRVPPNMAYTPSADQLLEWNAAPFQLVLSPTPNVTDKQAITHVVPSAAFFRSQLKAIYPQILFAAASPY